MKCNNLKQINKLEELKTKFFDSVASINTVEWSNFIANRNIYLSIPYLSALEQALKNEIRFCYITFHNSSEELVAIAYIQLAKFIDSKAKFDDTICPISGIVKSKILKNLEVKMLVCGNIFSCGENGFIYSPKISPTVAYSNLTNALDQFRKTEKNKEFSVSLIKEFWPENTNDSDNLLGKNYFSFGIDVNMVLKIHPSWSNLDAYLLSMTTKFRTRAKGVFKKSKEIIQKSFSEKDIREHEHRINELHGFVLDKADFNFGIINAQAFIGFKQNLKDNFCFTAYFLDKKLIGFSTAILFNGIMDANFVGIDYKYNNEYALYQKMLYDFVELSIERNLTELCLGRTAEEIKSCIGAEPKNMKLYIKHKNIVSNEIIKQMAKTVKPSKFELRKPFKAHFS